MLLVDKRHVLRPHILGSLGRHARTWELLDAAITREGVIICMLWRIAPIAPFVVSSVLIAMTGITQFEYIWTTSIGIIPSTIPIVSAAALGRSLLVEDEVDQVQVAFNVLSIGAGIYVMYRLAIIATEVLRRSGFSAEGVDSCQQDHKRARDEAPTPEEVKDHTPRDGVSDGGWGQAGA